MRDPLRNIEDFVREKLSFLDNSYPNDWVAFERKLQRAIFFRRLKIFTSFAVLTALLFLTHQGLISPGVHGIYSQGKPQTVQSDAQNERISESENIVEHDLQEISVQPQMAAQSIITSTPAQKITPNPSAVQARLKQITLPKREANFEMLESPSARSVIDLELAKAPSKREIEPSDMFFDIRSPNFKIEKPGGSQPYISPLQSDNAWSYAVNVYPNFTFRKFKVDPNKTNLLHSDFVHEMQNNQKMGFSMNIGLEVSKRIGPVTYLNSGVEYITNNYEADFDFTNFRDATIDPVSGEITGYQMKTELEQVAFADNNQFHYLNIPLTISYQPWANKHVRLNIEAGASYLRFMSARGTTIDYKTLEVIDLASQDYRQEMASFSMKFGAQYYVTPTINVGFEPTLMYFTNTIYTEEYPFYVIPYSVGLNFNVQVKLN